MSDPRRKARATDPRIEDASQWLSVVEDEAPSNETLKAFGDWLSDDPENAAAYDRVEQAWLTAGRLRSADVTALRVKRPREPIALPSVAKPERYGALRNALPFALAATVVLAVLLVLQQLGAGPSSPPEILHRTAVAQVREVLLADGSRITLGPASTLIELDFQADSEVRRVILDAGEALFKVAADPERPFFVVAGTTEARVTGTVFDVRRVPGATHIAVAEGSVTVSSPPSPSARFRGDRERVALRAGEQVVADDADGLQRAKPIAPERIGSWREGRLAYDDATLAEVVADLQRHQPRTIRLADARAGAVRISGMFNGDDAEAVLATLTELFPIDLEQAADGALVLRSRR
ncbi:MAG: FecR domain-containing protein [Pseudomonadota bacterium]